MSATLKTLLAWALLLALVPLTLDLHDNLAQVREQAAQSDRMLERIQSRTTTTDWLEQAHIASQAELAWAEKLMPVTSPGVFRAQAIEHMADLCKNANIQCQISAQGEKTNPTSATASPNANTPQTLSGLVGANVRIKAPANSHQLESLMDQIESGKYLIKIEKFTLRSGLVELTVQLYGQLTRNEAIKP
jgi:hypothetical protein